MNRTIGPVLKTIVFTFAVPGSVTVLIPWVLMGGFRRPGNGIVECTGLLLAATGSTIYFRCAWEFAVHGLGTPAPIAPTKYLVITALHRYVRNPMYIGVLLVLLGEAALFRAVVMIGFAAAFCVTVHLFVVFYEEPTLRRQFGSSYDQYSKRVPRWIPRVPG